ncbi:MAG: transporter substrate-binding protein [Betaproteobacteria bacterium]|jgi:NitT/TauT family transport system substrate-binding protein|nr:transporter substrate-binding protein [Betaproteobacteria bacterium]
MRIIKFIAVAAAVLAAAFAQAQSLEKKKITVAVGGKSLLYYLPLTIAERKGYFKSEGLDVEIVDFPGGAKALQAMVGGSADVVSGAYEHTINMHAKGQPIVGLALQGRYNGIVIGLSKAKAAQYKSPADLKGMKVGVTAPGSSTHMAVQNLAVKGGLKPDDFSAILVGASAGAVAAMKRGNIDAISNLDPVITKLETDGDIVVIADTRTAKGMKDVYGGAYHAGCIYAPVEWVKKNPNTTQAVVNAMVRAVVWLRAASVDDVIATVPSEYYGSDLALYRGSLLKNKEGYSPDGRFSMEGAQNVHTVLAAFVPEVQKAKIDLAQTFDNSFADRALKKYGGKR